jgi:hypothetical protein
MAKHPETRLGANQHGREKSRNNCDSTDEQADRFTLDTALSTEKAASARAAAERIKLRMARAAQDIIETGRELIEQKDNLGRGNFLPWIKDEFGMSEDTAQNFMRISSQFGDNTEHVRYLSYRALIALSSPSTPEPVRTEVLDRAANGEKVTATSADIMAMAAHPGTACHP